MHSRAPPELFPTSTVDPPWDQHGEHPVAPHNRLLDNIAVVRRSRNDGDAPLERVELSDALLTAHANHFVASIQHVLHHVLAELPRGPDNANLHLVPPVAPSMREPVGVARVLNGFPQRLVSCPWARMAYSIDD